MDKQEVPPQQPEAAASKAKKPSKAERAAARGGADKAAEEAAAAFVNLTLEDIGTKAFGNHPLIQSQKYHSLQWTAITELNASKAGESVWVRARISNSRAKGKLCFIMLRDGFSTAQATLCVSETVPKEMVKYAAGLARESVVDIQGTVIRVEKAIESATQSDIELQVTKIYCISESEARLPLLIEDASRPTNARLEAEEAFAVIEGAAVPSAEEVAAQPRVSQETRLNNRVLDLRVPAHMAIFRIQSGIGQLFREFLYTRDFVEIHTPKLIGTASEGGSNVFKVKYFEREAFLAQSPQLYKQMAVMGDLPRVFEVGPVFRAENSNTHRHLTEFVGLDLEMTIKEHYHEVLDVLDELFIFMFDGLNTRFAKELEEVRKQYGFEPLEYTKPTLRITFKEGIQMLREDGVDLPELEDIDTDSEKRLGRLVKAKYHTDFYMMERYPVSARPFYTMPCPDDENYTNSYDLFIRGEEITSGSQRIHDPELLEKRAALKGVDLAPIRAYVDSFKYGAHPHGGAGIGLERVAMLFLGIGNIRKTSMFPRDPRRLAP